MNPFSDLKGVHEGFPIAILGGGPSLIRDVQAIPDNSVLIGVNHHASIIGIEIDYLVFMDHPTGSPDLAECVRTQEGKRISPIYSLTDWDLSTVDYFEAGISSSLAAWCACYMGGDPVLLCGMDCYQGTEKYCHSRTVPYHPAQDYPIENHLVPWKKTLDHCEGSRVIRAMSGPLVEVFGAFSV